MNYRRAELKDIPGIILLEKKYHRDSISDEDKSGGFITTFFSENILTRLIEEEKGIAVARDGDRVVGFACAASCEFWGTWPVFQPMIDYLPNIKYKDTILSVNNSYQYGPVYGAKLRKRIIDTIESNYKYNLILSRSIEEKPYRM